MYNFMKQYILPKEFTLWALKILNRNNKSEEKKLMMIMEKQRREIGRIEKQLSQLLQLKISPNNKDEELLSDEEYLEEKRKLQKEKGILEETLSDTQQNKLNWVEHCEEFFDFTSNMQEKWLNGSQEDRKLYKMSTSVTPYLLPWVSGS